MATQRCRFRRTSLTSGGIWWACRWAPWGVHPKLIDTYSAKGAATMLCEDEETLNWLGSNVSTLKAWEGSRLKLVGLEALPTYKRVVAWFLGPAEDTDWYIQWLRRLNQGLNTSQWRVYGCKEELNRVHIVLHIMTEGMKWHPFSGVGQATFSLLGVKPEGRK